MPFRLRSAPGKLAPSPISAPNSMKVSVGATHAAPLASKILDYYYNRGGPAADSAAAAPQGTQP